MRRRETSFYHLCHALLRHSLLCADSLEATALAETVVGRSTPLGRHTRLRRQPPARPRAPAMPPRPSAADREPSKITRHSGDCYQQSVTVCPVGQE
ncbi:hypothetical protein NDU88_007984 [Pleurodeles waltl]|uniref:Secreted protein n=1 Tax=Pleurodeles waltl TaxID=8319 RepID=A0AAV7QQK7_PLEWA|nr:hypothetical protein NDU88_007984 [Pleurodeles waltl]